MSCIGRDVSDNGRRKDRHMTTEHRYDVLPRFKKDGFTVWVTAILYGGRCQSEYNLVTSAGQSVFASREEAHIAIEEHAAK